MTGCFHTTFILFNKFDGTVPVMETGLEYSQFFGIFRILLQITYPEIATKYNASTIVSFFSGNHIQ